MLICCRVFWADYLPLRGDPEIVFIHHLKQLIAQPEHNLESCCNIYKYLYHNTIWHHQCLQKKNEWVKFCQQVYKKIKMTANVSPILYSQLISCIPIGLCKHCAVHTSCTSQLCKRHIVPYMVLHRCDVPLELIQYIMSFVGVTVNGTYLY